MAEDFTAAKDVSIEGNPTPVVAGFGLRDDMLPWYVGITWEYHRPLYKDPYEPTRIRWNCHVRFLDQ